MVDKELIGAFLEAKKMTEDDFDEHELERNYIQSLCPIILRRIDAARKLYDALQSEDWNVTSLAKELGVTRQSIHNKDLVMDFIAFCRQYFPGNRMIHKNSKLENTNKELQERLDAFDLIDYKTESIKHDLQDTRAQLEIEKKQVENLSKTIRKKNEEINQLRKRLALNAGTDTDKTISALPRKKEIIATIVSNPKDKKKKPS